MHVHKLHMSESLAPAETACPINCSILSQDYKLHGRQIRFLPVTITRPSGNPQQLKSMTVFALSVTTLNQLLKDRYASKLIYIDNDVAKQFAGMNSTS